MSSIALPERVSKRVQKDNKWSIPSALLVLAISLAWTSDSMAQQQLYVKQDSLQRTMLDARSRLHRWQAQQQQACGAAKIETWRATTLRQGETSAQIVAAAQSLVQVNGEQVNGEKAEGEQAEGEQAGTTRWSTIRSDRAGHPVLAGVTADYLVTTITVDVPARLTLELSRHEKYGGFAYRPPPCNAGVRVGDALVWINGHQIPLHNRLEAYSRVSVAKRRGWHDLVLIDLDLESGPNQVVLSLRKGAHRSWFNVVGFTPQLTAALWALVERDFPRANNRLLDTIHFSWFAETDGWFEAAGTPQLECQFAIQIATDLGEEGRQIERRMAGLAQQNLPSSDQRWLDLCVTASELSHALRSLDTLRAATRQIASAFPHVYPGTALLEHIADLRARILTAGAGQFDPIDPAIARLLKEIEPLKREALVAKNPLLAGSQLVFVKRHAYDSDHYYDEFVSGIRRFGGNLCLLSIDDAQVTEIVPAFGEGVFDRFDLSFDAERILFNYKPPRPEGFRVYEIAVDGTNLRQVTAAPDDEDARIRTYATCSHQQLEQSPGRYGHWTDDMHPCYLPDGRIVFTSTRSQRSVLCGGHGLTVTNLYRINPDGSGLHQLSQGALSEFCPSVMNDGRILYNRWEYVDKGAGAVQSLWSMCPDGSRSEEVYGNNITTPGVFNQARNVPGRNDLIVSLGAGHCPGNIGAIVLIDLKKDKRSPAAMTLLTPDCVPKGNWGMRQRRNGRWIADIHGPWYCDPYPLADHRHDDISGKFFLVSCNPDGEWNDPAGYGLYLLDVFGNRVLIYRDPTISCWQPKPLRPRPLPPILSDRLENRSVANSTQATVLVSDIYQGLTGVPRGDVKYLRVMEQIPRPWSAYIGYQSDDRAPGQMVAISLYTHLSVKVLHGIVPVHDDGSAHFIVPANRNIFLQALDADFMEIQRMRTFVNFQPGEQRSCIGCHEPRNQAPVNRALLALKSPPVKPMPQPGEVAPRPLHYPTDIQPIFDRHCVSCHGTESPDGGLDLTGTMTELFSRSYENIIHKDLVGYIQEFVGPKPEGADAMGYAAAVSPYTYGSHNSKLMDLVRQGHEGAKLSREERVTLATWIDANAPYYGSYFGRRNIAHRTDPDFRPVPTLDSARGIRHNE